MASGEAPMRVLVGDELGLVKVVQGRSISALGEPSARLTWGEPSRAEAVEALASTSAPDGTPLVLVGRSSGCVDVLHAASGERLARVALTPAEGQEKGSGTAGGPKEKKASLAGSHGVSDVGVLGLHVLPPSFCFQDEIATLSGDSDELATSDPAPPQLRLLCVARSGLVEAIACETPASWRSVRSWRTRAAVQCSAYHAPTGCLVLGFQGSQCAVQSVALAGKLVFAAKTGKASIVGLHDRAWDSAVAVGGGGETSQGGEASAPVLGATPSAPVAPSSSSAGSAPASAPAPPVVVTGTAYHKVRVYRPNERKKPALETAWGESRVTALALEPGARRVWAANGVGEVHCLEVATGRVMGALKGISGSVRALLLDPVRNVLVSGGLDRHLRIHSPLTRTLLAKVYLKSRLTALAVCQHLDLVPAENAPDLASGEPAQPAGETLQLPSPSPAEDRKKGSRSVAGAAPKRAKKTSGARDD